MKIVIWIGNEPNQKALVNKINSKFPIEGIVTETRNSKHRITLSKIIEKVIEKIFLPSVGKSWWGMKEYYEKKYPNYPNTKIIDVENINCQAAYEFTKEIDPDMIIVSGTRLIKEKMLSLNQTIGILNLHTGLSPYVKGGPNCTNWCIATNQFHLIGNTIMWIDLGIDTGNIVTSEFTEFDGNEDLLNIHIKVMEHAHNLYLKAIDYLAKGNNSNVKQSTITNGRTYLSKEWGLKEKINLVVNLKKFKKIAKSPNLKKLRDTIKTVEI